MNGPAHSPHPFLSPRLSDRASNIFQQPSSPAVSSSTDYFSAHRSRKRSRHESVDERHSQWNETPIATPATQSWLQCPTPSDGMYGSACDANTGLVNERYMLRDGFDTPGLMAGTLEYDRSDEGMDRGKMRDEAPGAGRSEARMLSGPLARERNGIARTQSSPAIPTQKQQGWTSLAFGLVGKMFSFGTGVFRGFVAGGGQAYNAKGTPTASRPPSRPRLNRGSTPVPGAWREDDFMDDFEQDNASYNSSAPSRPSLGNKRRQTDKDSWVLVGSPDLTDTSPRRKISTSSIPRAAPASRPTASRASSRRSIAPAIPRRQSSYVTHSGSPTLDSSRPRSAHLDGPRRASFAPTRSRPSSAHEQNAYVSPEAERFVRRQAKQDRAADRAMSSMSKQLQDLIRQGQEALGTKVVVEDGGGVGGLEDMDEGYVDEDDAGWR